MYNFRLGIQIEHKIELTASYFIFLFLLFSRSGLEHKSFCVLQLQILLKVKYLYINLVYILSALCTCLETSEPLPSFSASKVVQHIQQFPQSKDLLQSHIGSWKDMYLTCLPSYLYQTCLKSKSKNTTTNCGPLDLKNFAWVAGFGDDFHYKQIPVTCFAYLSFSISGLISTLCSSSLSACPHQVCFMRKVHFYQMHHCSLGCQLWFFLGVLSYAFVLLCSCLFGGTICTEGDQKDGGGNIL